MAATVNCPQCDAPLELPEDIPAGKRLQCPDCGKAFAPPLVAELVQATPRTTSHSRRHDDDDLPIRRGKGGSIAIIAAIVGVILVGLGIAGGFVWIYIDDLRNREEAERMAVHSKSPPPRNVGPVGGPPVQGGMMPQGGKPGGPAGMPGAGGPAVVVPLKIGDAAPEITGPDLDGKPMKLSDFRGKVVVLDFWGDWCPPCRAAYNYQNHLINRMKDEPVVLLGVNTDTTKEQAKLVVNTHQLSWRSWHDGGGGLGTGPIAQRYSVTAQPTTFIIDPQGIIREIVVGNQGEDILDQKVDAVLAQGEERPLDAPQRWRPSSTGFSQLAEEVMIGHYLIRPPAGYTAEPVAITVLQETHRWKGPKRPDGTMPVFEVRITRAEPATKLEDVLEKDMQAIPSGRVGWICSAPMGGEVNGVVFSRVRWSIMESLNPPKYKNSGYLYAAVDNKALIRISLQDSESHWNDGAATAPLTFRKVK